MELLERYLKSVRSGLPEAHRDDIIKELSENIRSQIEDQESELGRPLSEAELEALLKQHGHPLLVAGRYRQDHRTLAFGRQLIGPTLFPLYTKVLSFNLGLTSVILVVVFTALFASGQPVTPLGIVPVFFYQLLIQFGIVTLIFSGVDMHLTKFPDSWDPRNPNRVHPGLGAVTDGPRVPRAESVAQFIALFVAVLWLRAVQHTQFLIFGPASAFLELSPVWHRFYLPIVSLALLGMAQAGVNLIRPDWTLLRSIVRITGRAGGLVISYFLLTAGNLVVSTSPALHSASHDQRVIVILNQTFFYTLLVTGVMGVFTLLRDLRRLSRGSRSPILSYIL
jgi:hypothetical protein